MFIYNQKTDTVFNASAGNAIFYTDSPEYDDRWAVVMEPSYRTTSELDLIVISDDLSEGEARQLFKRIVFAMAKGQNYFSTAELESY